MHYACVTPNWTENFNHMHTGQFYTHNKQLQERKVRIDYLIKICTIPCIKA